jgi:hypothetical protein
MRNAKNSGRCPAVINLVFSPSKSISPAEIYRQLIEGTFLTYRVCSITGKEVRAENARLVEPIATRVPDRSGRTSSKDM